MFHRPNPSQFVQVVICLLFISASAWGAVTGRIAGTVADASGGGIADVAIKLTNTAQGIETKAMTDARGEYSLPTVPVGTYDVLFEARASGLRSEQDW